MVEHLLRNHCTQSDEFVLDRPEVNTVEMFGVSSVSPYYFQPHKELEKSRNILTFSIAGGPANYIVITIC